MSNSRRVNNKRAMIHTFKYPFRVAQVNRHIMYRWLIRVLLN